MDDTRTVILVTHRQREILPKISHVLAVRDGKVLFQGRRSEVLTPFANGASVRILILPLLFPFRPEKIAPSRLPAVCPIRWFVMQTCDGSIWRHHGPG